MRAERHKFMSPRSPLPLQHALFTYETIFVMGVIDAILSGATAEIISLYHRCYLPRVNKHGQLQ